MGSWVDSPEKDIYPAALFPVLPGELKKKII
jgi:hypothetical protein